MFVKLEMDFNILISSIYSDRIMQGIRTTFPSIRSTHTQQTKNQKYIIFINVHLIQYMHYTKKQPP